MGRLFLSILYRCIPDDHQTNIIIHFLQQSKVIVVFFFLIASVMVYFSVASPERRDKDGTIYKGENLTWSSYIFEHSSFEMEAI